MRGEAAFRMSRARTKLEPGERLLLATRPHPAVLLPALVRALGVLLAAAVVLALLLRSSAPHDVRIALDVSAPPGTAPSAGALVLWVAIDHAGSDSAAPAVWAISLYVTPIVGTVVFLVPFVAKVVGAHTAVTRP